MKQSTSGKTKNTKLSNPNRSAVIFNHISELVTLDQVASKGNRNIVEADLSILKNINMVVDKGRIVWIGKNIPSDYLKAQEISLRGQIVLPGLVDAHTHMVFGGDRSLEFEMRTQGRTYQEISKAGGGIQSTIEATDRLSDIQLKKISQRRVCNHIRQGVTTVEIKSGYGLNRKSEMRILEIARSLKGPRVVTTYLGPHAVPAGNSKSEYMTQVQQDLKKIAKQKLADRADIFIESVAFSEEDAVSYFRTARDLGIPISVHTNQLGASGGVDVALNFGAQSVDHLNFLTFDQISKLTKSKTTCVLVPGADFYLKNPYAPARDLVDGGACVALASNFNPGSCPTQDLQFIGCLARLELKLKFFEILASFTVGGAAALGLSDQIGSLTVGKSADFVTTDQSLTSLFYEIGSRPFSSVWKEGKPIFLKEPILTNGNPEK